MTRDLLSRRTRSVVEDILAESTLREIATLFQDEGFAPAEAASIPTLGQRRTLVRQFHASIDFADPRQAARVLKAYRHLYDPMPAGMSKDRLAAALRVDGIDVGSKIWQLPPASTPTALRPLRDAAVTLDAPAIERQIELLTANVETDPRLVIGTAKELVETTCRTILREHSAEADRAADVMELLKATLDRLELVAGDVPEAKKGADTIRITLRTLTTTVKSIAELRNAYGSGHGPDGRAKGLGSRHARLSLNAAAAVATFLFETHLETKSAAAPAA